MTEVLIKAWEVSDEIKATSEYRHYQASVATLTAVPACKTLVDTYEQAKIAFQGVAFYGKSHPDYVAQQQVLIQARTALFQREEYLHYLETKRRLDDLLNNVTEAINDLIRPLDLNGAQACKKGPLHGKT